MPVDKASGPNGISNRVLREATHELSIPLCTLFNHSLTLCIVPDIWKDAHVSAVFKKGEASLPRNYRPVSLLNTIDKVFERAVFKHLYNRLHSINFLSPLQSGFVHGDSTVNHRHSCIKRFARFWTMVFGLFVVLQSLFLYTI